MVRVHTSSPESNRMNVKQRAAKWWSKHLKDQSKRDIFEAKLIALLPDGDWCLDSDYDPTGLLLEAVIEAGIPCRGFFFSSEDVGFPEKTALRYWGGMLEQKIGYGKPFEAAEI